MTLNDYIAKAKEATDQPAGIPVKDRTEQTDYGVGLARRMAEHAKQAPQPPARMVPIVPVAS